MTHTNLLSLLPLFNIAVRLAGYRAAELAGRPWSIVQRRFAMGMLVLGSASFSAVMLTVALSRIDPDSAWRWPAALAGGLIYFVMVASFDSLFVSTTERISRRSAIARVVLSLIVSAFSAITLDAAIAGDRLVAEIEARRVEADLALASQHAKVHGLAEKGTVAASSQKAVSDIEARLLADPPSPEFRQLQTRVQRAEQQWQALERTAVPQLAEVRSSLAEARAQLANLKPEADPLGTESLSGKVAQLRARRDDLDRQVREAQGTLTSARQALEGVRTEWKAEQMSTMEVARHRATLADEQLQRARSAADKDAAASREVNAKAYKANLVEQTAAFWSLAQRETAYQVIGLAVWIGAMALELLAIAVKLLLKPDELDEERSFASEQRRLESEAMQDALVEALANTESSPVATKLRGELLAKEVAALAAAKQMASNALLSEFARLQADRAKSNDSSLLRSLDKHFVGLQVALDEALIRHFKPKDDLLGPDLGAHGGTTGLKTPVMDL